MQFWEEELDAHKRNQKIALVRTALQVKAGTLMEAWRNYWTQTNVALAFIS